MQVKVGVFILELVLSALPCLISVVVGENCASVVGS